MGHFKFWFFGLSMLVNVATLPAAASTGQSTLPRRTFTPEPDHLSLEIPSFVIHGVQPTTNAAQAMDRRLDDGGHAVVTPGIGLQYKGEGGLLVLSAILKDCYDDLAGTLQLGHAFRLGKATYWGLTMGVYARETPMECDTTASGRFGSSSVHCTSLDTYPIKWMTTVNGESVDLIPMPFLHFSTALYKDRDFELDVKVMSNWALNEFGFSIPF